MSDLKYCGPVPDKVKDLITPLAKSIAFEFGQASKRADLFVTHELMELIGLCILGAASQTAHQVLVNQNVLMADTTVKQWVLS